MQVTNDLPEYTQQLEVVVVASALDDMQDESRLAVVSHSLPRRYRQLSKVNTAYRITE